VRVCEQLWKFLSYLFASSFFLLSNVQINSMTLFTRNKKKLSLFILSRSNQRFLYNYPSFPYHIDRAIQMSTYTTTTYIRLNFPRFNTNNWLSFSSAGFFFLDINFIKYLNTVRKRTRRKKVNEHHRTGCVIESVTLSFLIFASVSHLQ
jgi:hypothetical protein